MHALPCAMGRTRVCDDTANDRRFLTAFTAVFATIYSQGDDGFTETRTTAKLEVIHNFKLIAQRTHLHAIIPLHASASINTRDPVSAAV